MVVLIQGFSSFEAFNSGCDRVTPRNDWKACGTAANHTRRIGAEKWDGAEIAKKDKANKMNAIFLSVFCRFICFGMFWAFFH